MIGSDSQVRPTQFVKLILDEGDRGLVAIDAATRSRVLAREDQKGGSSPNEDAPSVRHGSLVDPPVGAL